VRFLEGFVEELELEDIHLVVHDLGGPVGLGFAAADPDEIASVTLVETLWSTLPDGLDALGFVADYQSWLQHDRVPKLVIDVVPGLLSNALVPVDGADGARVRQADFAATAFPEVSVVTLEDAGHFVQEDRPDALGQQIAAFLDDLDGDDEDDEDDEDCDDDDEHDD
jgi:pimeloyl-ACP methyl ester carboxylesterase